MQPPERHDAPATSEGPEPRHATAQPGDGARRTGDAGVTGRGGATAVSPEAPVPTHQPRREPDRASDRAPDPDAEPSGRQRAAAERAWSTLRSYQDPARYVKILTPHTEDGGVHPLLRAPAGLTTVSGEMPDTEVTRAYLRHSCDLTLRGGVDAAVTYPLAACALAEEYLVRRVGGASAAAATAAAIAAAELGRRTPTTPATPPSPITTSTTSPTTSGAQAVPAATSASDAERTSASSSSTTLTPGYAGLAQLTGWLAGDRDEDRRHDGAQERAVGADQHRLARLLPPSRALSAPYRVLVAAARSDLSGRGWWSRRRAVAVGAALAAVPGQAARLAVGLVWLGVLLVWIGLTVALLRSPTVQPWVVVVAALALLVTAVLAGIAATVVAAAVAVPRLLRDRAPAEQYGLVPGVPDPDEGRQSGLSLRLNRLAGVPNRDGVPPLFTWLADALDDLAGLASPEQGRRALTFGDLWLGRPIAQSGDESGRDMQFLRRAAADPERRAIELRIVATDLTRGRPVQLPFAAAHRRVASSAGHQWLFCRHCLAGGLPGRVVEQMVAGSHLTRVAWAGARCPRHGSPLLAFPDPWNLPVVVAVRMAVSPPGLLRSVPLYTAAATNAAGVRAASGSSGRDESERSPADAALATHWFCGDGAADAPVSMFDTVLPRWPTFGLSVDTGVDLPDDEDGRWVEVPETAAGPPSPPSVRIGDLGAFVSAARRTRSGWQDRAEAELPGARGRVGIVRRGVGAGHGIFLTEAEILRLALRGHHAGQELRTRFTGRDGDVNGQTGADRYRWVRLRSALRDYRRQSLEVAARLPLYADFAATYRVPAALSGWFGSEVTPGRVDPAWADAAAALTHLRSLGAGGVLGWDTEDGAPPEDVQ